MAEIGLSLTGIGRICLHVRPEIEARCRCDRKGNEEDMDLPHYSRTTEIARSSVEATDEQTCLRRDGYRTKTAMGAENPQSANPRPRAEA